VYAECIYALFIKILSFLLNTMLFVDKLCCDEFPIPQTDRKCKQAKEHSGTENFKCNLYGDNSLSDTPKISKFVDN